MARPPGSYQHDEDLEEDEKPCYGEDFIHYHDSSSHKAGAGKMDEKRGSVNDRRTKHSETEQRRRSKINERFQVLRDIIPQNDQRRDKASFLLEVVEYIRFLQEKVQMYEGLYHGGYNQEQTKQTPWRNNSWTVDNHDEPAGAVQNGKSHGSNVLCELRNVNSCVEFYAAVPLQMRSGTLAPVVRDDLSGTVQQPLPDVGGMVFHPQPQLWPAMPLAADCILPNNSGNQHEPLDIENGSESLSSAYSRRILSTLTEALQNNGVDMSQASISVQIDVGKHASFGASSTLSSKDHNNDRQCIPAVALGGEKSHG